MATKFGNMVKNTNSAVKKLVISFGRIASGDHLKVNIQNTANSEIRNVKSVTPYGISSCPLSGLFAQMIVNNNTDNSFVGVHDPNAPKVEPGEIMLYSKGGAYIHLKADGTIIIDGKDIFIG